MSKGHRDQHLREVIDHAKAKGWTVEPASGSAHIWGKLKCPGGRDGCPIIFVPSTPTDPQSRAKTIRRKIDACQHSDAGTAGSPT